MSTARKDACRYVADARWRQASLPDVEGGILPPGENAPIIQ